jgi:biotin transport system substrate-specific component
MSANAAASVHPSSPATDLALVAVFAALIAAFALTPGIPMALGVPITLQSLAVALTGMVLGARRGFLAVLLYLVVGFAGLPVFANGGAGLGMFAKASIGYLLGFPLGAALCGFLSYRFLGRARRPAWIWLFVAGLAATVLVIHPAGIVGMAAILHLDAGKAVLADLPFLPGDVLKNVAAGLIAAQVHRAFPGLATPRR